MGSRVVGEERRAPEVLARLVPTSSRRVPRRRDGVIDRDDLVKALVDADVELVVVSAPAGFGKTTTAALWAEVDRRPFAWVALGRLDGEAQHLLRHVAAALSAIEPLAEGAVDIIAGPGRSIDLEVVPALQQALQVMRPFVLVLDDAHLLESPEAVGCVEALVEALPDGASVALVGRNVAAFDLARRRVSGQLVELDAGDLVMSEDDARRLFDWSGVALGEERLADLVARTEGWPAALHLAELSIDAARASSSSALFSGRDRLVADYLVEEVLGGLPEPLVWFLERSAVLDRMSAPLLDDLLGVDNSGRLLDDIERSGNLFLVPLDAERRWYRYHQLFADLLGARLERRDPVEATRLQGRASRLVEAAGDIDGAVRHALNAGEPQRAADLILGQAARTVLNGRTAMIQRWLEELGPNAAEADPVAAMCWGWVGFGTGDIALMQRSIRTALMASVDVDSGTDGATRVLRVLPAGDLFRAILGMGGVVGTVESADAVIAADVVDPTWTTIAMTLRGIARAVSGDEIAARADLLEVLPVLGELPVFGAGVRSHLALLDLADGDGRRAERWARDALAIAHRERLEAMPAITVTFAVGALMLARAGENAPARAELAIAAALLDRLGDGPTRTMLLGHTLLAATALLLDDRALVGFHLAEAERARAHEPGAHEVNRLLDDTRAAVASERAVPGRPALTPAELRLLPLLATHLPFQEIAGQLYVSRNTVKTHAMTIYRKLGTTSRSGAVAVARELGLLAD